MSSLIRSSCAVTRAVETFYQQFEGQRLWLGFSGGLDSTVLLHALVKLKPDDKQVTAIHVHHGLQAQADEWVNFCQRLCETWGVAFKAVYVELDAQSNIEAAARSARYQAFASIVPSNEQILTAHHQRDQAETFILNLLRGAGVSGLAAMPKKRQLLPHLQAWLIRPLLSVAYQDILDYAQQHQLSWHEDPMNQDLAYRRNFIRHQLLPLMQQAWSSPEKKLAQAAEHLAESAQLLEELAQQDLLQIEQTSNWFNWQQMQSLTWARQKNLLSYWFYRHHGVRLDSASLDWFRSDCFNAAPTAQPRRILAGKQIRRYRNCVFYPVEIPKELYFEWQGIPAALPEGIVFNEVVGGGVALTWFSGAHRLVIRSLLQTDLLNRKALKNWFQTQNVPPWQRQYWPVLEIDGQLAAIKNYRVMDGFCAQQHEKGLKFEGLN